MRIIVTRCEIDLKSICKEFECETNSTVEEWIRDETSGDYRSLLLVLIGVE
ncbi:unnamed protein product [Heterobilharzia americana]|nr:unnamed protein product [Heterobilharzia americana]